MSVDFSPAGLQIDAAAAGNGNDSVEANGIIRKRSGARCSAAEEG
jgi:hypothetical protein